MAERRPKRQRNNRSPGASQPAPPEALALSSTPIDKRLRRAEEQRSRLLRRIAKRQSEVKALQSASPPFSPDASQPLVTALAKRQRTLEQLQQALSRCLERTGSLSARQHALVRRTYGPVLREITRELDANEPRNAKPPRKRRAEPKPAPSPSGSPAPSPPELKAIYLDLVAAFHPDREVDEHLRQQRTEALKQINQAYATGDAASLLRRHSDWQTSMTSRKSPAARLAECENENRQLLKQLRDLTARRKPLRMACSHTPMALHQLHEEQRALDALLFAARQYLEGSVEAEHFIALAPEQGTEPRP